jgi:RNA polymerase sigma factor (sigma-70 family)
VSAETQRKRFADFVATEWHRLVGYARAWIADAADRDAEDVVQDVLASVFESDALSRPIADLSAYLYRALRNRAIDLYRRPRRAAELPAEIADDRRDVGAALEREEDLEAMFEAIDELPEAQREVLVATELQGRSFKELSAEWGVPIGTLLARKHRAIRAVREALTGGVE